MLQEMLTNVSRHSQASKVTIRLGYAAGLLSLEVADNGKGITPDRAEADDSFGIIGMRERCAAFGGTLVVQGSPGVGSTFAVRIPFSAQEESQGRA
jgi:signal transduction histidine kinase